MRLGPALAGVLAPNPGPMTLTGTNTWVVGDASLGAPVVVDPGPDDVGHRSRVLAEAGGRASVVLLTHGHLDHSEGARAFAGLAGCAVRSVDPTWRTGADGLVDGDVVEVAGTRLEVVATPGHTRDSVSLLVTHDDLDGEVTDLLTGDTVLGAGTTVITHPGGDLGDYLASLDRLLALVAERGVRRVLPGHGPVVTDPAGVLHGYREHRLARLEQVRAARARGATTPEEVLALVYPDVLGTPLAVAAAQSVRAQLDHLAVHRDR